jgi:hypothetical protein
VTRTFVDEHAALLVEVIQLKSALAQARANQR